MITKEQAMTADNFVHNTLKNADGTPMRARRMGRTKTWITRPGEFRIPVMHGLYNSFYIGHINSIVWDVA